MADSDRYICSGNVVIGLDSNRVWELGPEVELSQAEFIVLWRLAKNEGHVVVFSRLLDTLMDEGLAGERHNLDIIISRLRQKLGASSIRTYRGIGYRLA